MPITSMDLVANILDNKPAEVSAGFHQVMMDKIHALVNDHKKVVAANLFGGGETPSVTPEPETKDNEKVVADSKAE
jgi:hypothetical protein